MIKQMAPLRIGSIWSVIGLKDAAVVVLSGPFAAARFVREYLVAPVYTGAEPGFVWTSEDVLLHPSETGLGGARYAAIWNARPILEADLGLELGTLPTDVTELVKDFYWASINERKIGKHERLGKDVDSANDPAARFQASELERWEPLSGRVFMEAITGRAGFVRLGETWTLGLDEMDDLWQQIEDSESLLGDLTLDAVGHEWVRLTAPLVINLSGIEELPAATLFEHAYPKSMLGWSSAGGRVGWGVDLDLPANPEPVPEGLAEAA